MSADELLQRPRAHRRRARRTPRQVALRALLVSAAAGPLVGLLWWLVTPGGLRATGSSYLDVVQSVGAGDASFAVACLVAGAVAGIWWVVAREEDTDARSVGRLVGLLVGGALGAALAWGTGALLQVLLPGAAVDVPGRLLTDPHTPALNLAVLAGALLWPLAVGVLVVVDTLRDLLWRVFTEDRSG